MTNKTITNFSLDEEKEVKYIVVCILKCLRIHTGDLTIEIGGSRNSIPLEKNSFLTLTVEQKDCQISFKLPHDGDKVTKFSIPKGESGIKEVLMDSLKLFVVYGEPLDNNFVNCFPEKKIIGHRGSGKKNIYETKKLIENKNQDVIFYENTVSSFNQAHKDGAGWVELDVQLTRDRIPIVFHNFELNTENDTVFVEDLTLDYFLKYFKNEELKNEIPDTLQSLLTGKDEELGLNVEIKYRDEEYIKNNTVIDLIPINEYVDRIINVLSENYSGKIMFSSFHKMVLIYLRLRLPRAKILFIIEHNPEEINQIEKALSFCLEASLDGLVMNFKAFETCSESLRLEFKRQDLKIYIYGKEVSDEKRVESLLKNGVDGVITDNIPKVIHLN